jgi:hypothetical protein
MASSMICSDLVGNRVCDILLLALFILVYVLKEQVRHLRLPEGFIHSLYFFSVPHWIYNLSRFPLCCLID